MSITRILVGAAGGSFLVLVAACREDTKEYGEGNVRAAEREMGENALAAEERARAEEAATSRDAARPLEASFGDAESAPQHARVDLQPIGGSGVTGVVRFERTGDTLHVQGRIEGLTPGLHGFHVHEFGDLSDTQKGESAGSHFAPHRGAHGMPDSETRHVGDLGNLEAGEDGVAVIDIRDARIQLHGENSILGRALVVHANPDDGGQPVGNAGGRVAFGVVAIANPTPR
jgi:Cu-Zn family superoxide dismutase